RPQRMKGRARTDQRRPRRTRLELEVLEDRTVPSHLIILSGGGTASGSNSSNGNSATLSVGANQSAALGAVGGLYLDLADCAPYGNSSGGISTNASGEGVFSASSQITATYQIVADPGAGDQLGDPAIVEFSAVDNSHNAGGQISATFSYTVNR